MHLNMLQQPWIGMCEESRLSMRSKAKQHDPKVLHNYLKHRLFLQAYMGTFTLFGLCIDFKC